MPLKLFSRSDRQLHRNHVAPEGRSAAIPSRDQSRRVRDPCGCRRWRAASQTCRQYCQIFRHDFHAVTPSTTTRAGFHRGHGHLGFVDEHVEAGRIDEVDLRFAPFDDRVAAAMDIAREISSSSYSVVAVPSSTRPSCWVAPAVKSMADREVLPECECPTRATLRMFAPS